MGNIAISVKKYVSHYLLFSMIIFTVSGCSDSGFNNDGLEALRAAAEQSDKFQIGFTMIRQGVSLPHKSVSSKGRNPNFS